MLPGMAAMVPGGCVEVDWSECNAGTGTTGGTNPTGGFGSPVVPTGAFMDGPTEITVQVKEPTELKPYSGGADVVISGFNIRNFNSSTGAPNLTEIARGKTDSRGQYVWSGQAPSPNVEYHYQVSISIPGGRAKTIEVPARTPDAAAAANHMLSTATALAVVCPPNIDPITCAAAEAQLDTLTASSRSSVAQFFASKGGPAVVGLPLSYSPANVGLGYSPLAAHNEMFRWWIGDLEIPPKDWPDLVKNFNQTWNIFAQIPFPRWPGIEKLFSMCARAVPIGQGKHNELYSVVTPRIYVKTFSDYFPRTDKQISKDMAAAYMMGLQPILLCMQHRIERKIEETKRSLKTLAIISYCVMLVNLPLLLGAGAAGFAAIATETWDFIKLTTGNQTLGFGVSSAFVAAAALTGDPQIIVKALEPIIRDVLKDVDPLAAQAITAIYPQVVSLAMSAVGSIAGTSAAAGSNLVVNGASSFIDLTSVGVAIAVMAVKALAAIPKMYAAKKMEALGDALAGAESAAKDMLAFVAGEEVSPEFKPFLMWVVEALGIVDLMDQAIDDFLNQFQQALQAGGDQGGSVTVVPEGGGGGPAVVPTDPAGTPTDVHGTPLPGGVAPETPPSGGSTIPGVPPPTMPPMPTTTDTPGMQGVSTLGAAAGVGGAALALLLVTGAVS